LPRNNKIAQKFWAVFWLTGIKFYDTVIYYLVPFITKVVLMGYYKSNPAQSKCFGGEKERKGWRSGRRLEVCHILLGR
jgi:hypothetical protein